MEEKRKLLGVTFEGATVVSVKLDSNSEEAKRFRELVRNSVPTSGGGYSGGNRKPPHHGGGSKGDGGSPNDYLPGRLGSQFEDKALGRPSIDMSDRIKDNGRRENPGLWSVGVEIWRDSDGNYYEAKVGTQGAVFAINQDNRVTIHKNGHVHEHGSFSENPPDSWGYQVRWVTRESLISTIIDKGPPAKLK